VEKRNEPVLQVGLKVDQEIPAAQKVQFRKGRVFRDVLNSKYNLGLEVHHAGNWFRKIGESYGYKQEELYKCYRGFYGSWERRLSGIFSPNKLKRRIYRYLAARGLLNQLRDFSR
jgi:hypothetical protein